MWVSGVDLEDFKGGRGGVSSLFYMYQKNWGFTVSMYLFWH